MLTLMCDSACIEGTEMAERVVGVGIGVFPSAHCWMSFLETKVYHGLVDAVSVPPGRVLDVGLLMVAVM